MMKRSLTLVLFALLALGSFRSAAQPPGAPTLRGRTYAAGFDLRDGRLVSVRARGTAGLRPSLAFTPRGGSLWRLDLRDGRTLRSADLAGTLRRDAAPGGALRMTWRAKEATVTLDAVSGEEWVDLRLRVTPHSADMLSAALPAGLRFDPAAPGRVLFPHDMGLALKPGFFGPQGEDGPWNPAPVGPAGLRRVAPSLSVGAGSETLNAVTVTDGGRALLGEGLARAWQGRQVVTNRPARPEPDLPLLTTPGGVYLGGHALGRGLLVRFAGFVKWSESALAVATVERLLAGLTRPPDGVPFAPGMERRRVVLLAPQRGPLTGGWSETPITDWRRALPASSMLHESGLEVIVAETPASVMAALRDPQTFAVVNPWGEALPCGAGGWPETADAARAFIERGGVWVETGGHPFYFALVHAPYQSLEADYPGGFSDFARVETRDGALALYGVQDARNSKTILTPARWRTWADTRGGYVERTWRALVRRGETWQSPLLRLRIGGTTAEAVRAYVRDNGLGHSLAETVPASLLQRWKRAVTVAYLGDGYAAQARGLDRLPPGSLVHVVDFLRGGFDKQYPDLLPPNPAFGTPEAFRAVIDRARSLGHLVMPYTNHTWWCDDPKGPTFAREGDGPLLRDVNGRAVREWYGPNGGWSVCPWHPAVIAAADRIVEQFTREYPADILFQDQVGARSWITVDLNPAAPVPWAYNQGWVNLARRQAKRVPLATEHGFDRLMGAQAQFCGLTWNLVPFDLTPVWLAGGLRPYASRMRDADWEVFPLAQSVANGGALFAVHLGGPFATSRAPLLWTLALGMQITCRVSPSMLERGPERNDLFYLDRVQKTLGPRCMGAPLLSFRYLAGSGPAGVLETVFPGARIVTNLTPQPFAVADVEVAPWGFYATGPGMEVGILSARGGKRFAPEPLRYFREEEGGTMILRNDGR